MSSQLSFTMVKVRVNNLLVRLGDQLRVRAHFGQGFATPNGAPLSGGERVDRNVLFMSSSNPKSIGVSARSKGSVPSGFGVQKVFLEQAEPVARELFEIFNGDEQTYQRLVAEIEEACGRDIKLVERWDNVQKEFSKLLGFIPFATLAADLEVALIDGEGTSVELSGEDEAPSTILQSRAGKIFEEVRRAAVTRKPNIDALAERVVVLVSEESFEAALVVCDEILELEPRNLNALENKEMLLWKLGRNDEAQKCSWQVKRVRREKVVALYVQGRRLLDAGNYDEAINAIEEVATFLDHLEDLDVWAFKGKKVDRLSDLDSPEVWNSLGVAYKRTGRNAEALECYERALEIMPESVLVLHNISVVLIELNQLEEALEHSERALECFYACRSDLAQLKERFPFMSDFVDGYFSPGFEVGLILNQAKILQKIERYDEAAENFMKIINLEPDRYRLIGYMHTETRHLVSAKLKARK